ncbi:MAG: hypothetical protein WCY11_07425 [Novosphingobium sp.]
MIARAGSGWQYALADLSLILFLVTAAALASDGVKPASGGPSLRSEPLAVYRVEAGAPRLVEWLATQPPDPRQQLTIVARYRRGGQARAIAQAEGLARDAGQAGTAARIVIEPGEGGTIAALAYDAPQPALSLDPFAASSTAPVAQDLRN